MKSINDMSRDELLDYINQLNITIKSSKQLYTNIGYSNCIDEYVNRRPNQTDVEISSSPSYSFTEVRNIICDRYKCSQINFIFQLIICDIKQQLGLNRDGKFDKLDDLISTIYNMVKDEVDSIIKSDPTQATILSAYELFIAPIVQRQVHEFTVNLMMETFGPQN